MTIEERLQQMIGAQAMQIAHLLTENERLQEENTKLKASKEPREYPKPVEVSS